MKNSQEGNYNLFKDRIIKIAKLIWFYKEYQRSRRKVDNFQAQISESDKIIRELRSREEDLSESIKSKDSQLAILRVRYNENETELNLKIKEIELVRSESDR